MQIMENASNHFHVGRGWKCRNVNAVFDSCDFFKNLTLN